MLQMIVVLLGISFVTFLLTYLAPGDPATAMYESIGVTPTEEMLEIARENMGLDKPFLEQYMTWFQNCFRGDFGVSFSKNEPVLALIAARLPNTLRLALLSMVLMLFVSLPLGIYSAVRQDRLADYLVRGVTFAGISLPGFLIGLILLYIFALKLRLVPVASSTVGLKQMLLPAVTLTIGMASKYIRQVRTAILEELSQDYVIGARARGMNFSMVLWKHVLPNSLLPLLTMLGLSFGSLMGGVSVVELIFSYPGLGVLAIGAVKARDYPLIQGFVLWIALVYMLVNFVVDLSYNLVDPRIREGK